MKEYWVHFNDSTLCPVLPSTLVAPAPPASSSSLTTPAPITPTTSFVEEIAQWDKDEQSARALLTQQIPDSTLIHVQKLKTVQERWAAITQEFLDKGSYAKIDLHSCFLESKDPEKGNVCTFLEGLHTKRQDISAVDINIENKDYLPQSLPLFLHSF